MLAAASDHARAKRMLSANVTLWDIPTEDLWARDAGPLIAHKGSTRVVSHIQFNGWGKKQVDARDSRVAGAIADRLGFDMIKSGLRGEAGVIEHDGHGLLMAHESSWVNDNRNPGLSRSEVEQRLLAAYGAERMIWSEGVWDEDITDYHIDSLARFTGPNRVLINLPDTPDWDDGFRDTLEQYHYEMCALGARMVRIALAAIGAKSTAMDMFAPPTTWLRLLHYPPAPATRADDLYGSAPHTDFGALTFLATDDVGGLQVLSTDGDWIAVPPRADAFVVNVGDMLHRLSNGLLRSTPHRVINTTGRERYSCPFFYDPHVSATVAPLIGIRPIYEPLNFGDFLRHELEASYDAHKPTHDT